MKGSPLVKGTMPLLILSVLRRGELHGYEIAQRMAAGSGVFSPSQGALYPALHRLEADGALEGSWRKSDRGPRRRYYRITKSGLERLAEHEREWQAVANGIQRLTAEVRADG